MKQYDVFISHKSDNKPWVEVLARNLKAQGFSVFLDKWELSPGESIIDGLYRGLVQSRNGILVVTPEAFESGWVREEYDQMIQQKKEPGYKFIPVILGAEVPDFPFMQNIRWVDFRDPVGYKEAFYQLVCALHDQSPGERGELEGELIYPEPPGPGNRVVNGEKGFEDQLMELFFTKQAVVLLAQADGGQRRVQTRTRLLERAKNRYGEKNMFHLSPPVGSQVNMQEYFTLLGKQCGLYGEDKDLETAGAAEFRGAMEERLKTGEPFFLLVSAFENGLPEVRRELAGIFRGLNELYPDNFKILICGGEKLADLVYMGELSYLNHMEIREWPEMTTADVKAQAMRRGTELDEKTTMRLLRLSGGHAEILALCLDLYARNLDFSDRDLVEKLLDHPFVWRLFMPFLKDVEQKKRLCELLASGDVGPFMARSYDKRLKRLYWNNLIKRGEGDRRLWWRCEALREVGRQILECKG